MTRVFVDTSALVCHLDADDPRHGRVRAQFAAFRDDELVTHGYVVAESVAVVRRRLGVDAVAALIDEALPAISVSAVDRELHATALARYRQSLPGGTSFVDHVSLEFMRRESIEVAFVLDTDFGDAAVRVVP